LGFVDEKSLVTDPDTHYVFATRHPLVTEKLTKNATFLIWWMEKMLNDLEGWGAGERNFPHGELHNCVEITQYKHRTGKIEL